jgi:hypothetical protein
MTAPPHQVAADRPRDGDAAIEHPLGILVTEHFRRRPMPLRAVLSALASQEHADGDEGNAMQAARDLLGAIWEVVSSTPELNMSNFDTDEVETLNEAMIEVFKLLQPAMDPTP